MSGDSIPHSSTGNRKDAKTQNPKKNQTKIQIIIHADAIRAFVFFTYHVHGPCHDHVHGHCHDPCHDHCFHWDSRPTPPSLVASYPQVTLP
jgi:hypothetical protein